VSSLKPTVPYSRSALPVLGCLAWQWMVLAIFCLFVVENEPVVRTFVSVPLWEFWLQWLGGTLHETPDGLLAIASLAGIGLAALILCVAVDALAALLVTMPMRKSGRAGHGAIGEHSTVPTFDLALRQKIRANAYWTWPIAAWNAGWIVSLIFPVLELVTLLGLTAKLVAAATLAGWFWEAVREWWPSTTSRAEKFTSEIRSSAFKFVLIGMLIYMVIFVGMNWGLWFNLQLPHGDSSMYEEHLWNVLHGKGFRSYLDQGLFLGEHIQVIHLLLLPLYLLWPSHLFMELSESAVLALGAIPVLSIARRHGRSEFAALLVALAYLLYFPMQYLDIAIDLKTFRPSAFGIPALLWMIDSAERRRWGWMSLCVALALACQEDFAVAIAPFGVWLLVNGLWKWHSGNQPANQPANRTDWKGEVIAGAALSVLMPLYVIWAVKVAIPWFHGGATVHYASYFQAFGKTPVEIVINILTNPQLLWRNLVTAGSVALFLDLLLPVGMPVRAWRALLVGLPLFVLLCLNELTRSFPGPFHHFHAPLIPTLLWGTCLSLASVTSDQDAHRRTADQRALWVFCCALTTTFFFSLSPLGIQFWDSGSPFYWERLYVPDERSREFAKVLPLIPPTARVASTDFIHPRFTHYERSYDYSHYPRRVADYQDRVPDDTDYIVIDTGHRYSEIQRYEQMREYQHQRDQWELVPVDTKGYFIVLKRVKYPQPESGGSHRPSKSGSLIQSDIEEMEE